MSRPSRVFPILSSTDLPRLVRFYEQAFGAEIGYRWPTDGGDAQYVALQLGADSVGVGADPEAPPGHQRCALWLQVDDCDAAVADALAAGAALVSAPQDMPWGERVADLTDPDGTLLHLGQGAG